LELAASSRGWHMVVSQIERENGIKKRKKEKIVEFPMN
jgi:hypothetical protein